MKKLKINLQELQLHFESGGLDFESYLDIETGSIIWLDDDDTMISEAELENYIERYELIPQQNSREGYQDMVAYIGMLDDDHLIELLETAIQGSGAFRRFKDVLLRYPEARENWFTFRDSRIRQRIVDWLKPIEIEPEFV